MNSHRHGRMRSMLLIAVIGLTFISGDKSQAMREIGGKEPMKEGPWPDGCVAVANLPTRLAYSTGDGADHEFVYRGETKAFQTALIAFGAIRAPALALHIHQGPNVVSWAKSTDENGVKDNGHVDWTFTVWNAEEWHNNFNSPESRGFSYQIRGHQPVPTPRIDVYVASPATPVGVDWTQVTVPDGVKVTDERPTPAQKAISGKGALGPVIQGVIYDMANGKTIAGVTFEVRKAGEAKWETVASSSTDAAGRFKIETLPPGSYLFVAGANGYAWRILGSDTVYPETHLKIDGELSEAVTVKGTVADAQEKPLPGIVVQIEQALGIDSATYQAPETMTTKTDAAGRFTFIGAPSGYAHFSCKGADYEMLNPRTLWSLTSWKTLTQDAQNVRKTGEVPVALHMAVPGIIRCKVVGTDGKPLKDDWEATIADAEGGCSPGRFSYINKHQRTVPVQRDGTAEFTGVPVGRYYVVIGYQINFATEVKTVSVNVGQTVVTTLSVTPRPEQKPEVELKPVKPPKPTNDDKF